MNKDLAKSIKAEVTALRHERDDLQDQLSAGNLRLETLNSAIGGLDQLLVLHGINPHAPDEDGDVAVSASDSKSLADMLRELLSDRSARHVDAITEVVRSRGYDFGDKNPKRAVGFTLLGLSRSGHYKHDGNGNWRYTLTRPTLKLRNGQGVEKQE